MSRIHHLSNPPQRSRRSRPGRVFRRLGREALFGILVLTGLFLVLSAVGPAVADSGYTGHCDIQFFGTSTFHNFSGTVTSQPFHTCADPEDTLFKLLRKAKVTVNIKDMDTGNSLMNRNMYKMFEAKDYPLITGIIADTPGEETITVQNIAIGDTIPLDITFHGHTNTIKAHIENIRTAAATTVVTGVFDLSLTDYGIEPPRFFLFMKVHDTVRVHVDVITCRVEKAEAANTPSPKELPATVP